MLEFHFPLNLIVDDIVIVYNIFYANDYIYVISNNYFREDNTKYVILDFKVNNIPINNINLYTHVKACHSINVFKIQNNHGNENILLTIIYNSNNYDFSLSNKNFISSETYNTLSLMTLFKDDYLLLPVYINYYKSIGIKYFTFYFNYTNDSLKNLKNIDKIIEDIDKDNSIFVNFIEWPYNYWKCINNITYHGAQISAMADMYYKSFYKFKYLYFNDLDEYLFFDDPKILNIQDFLENHNEIDVFQFNMYYSKYINENTEKDNYGRDIISYCSLEKNFDIKNFTKLESINHENNIYLKSKVGSTQTITDNEIHEIIKNTNIDILDRSKILLKTNLYGCGVHKELSFIYCDKKLLKKEYKRVIMDGFYHLCNLKEKPRSRIIYK